MKPKWKAFCKEGGIRQHEKNLILFERLPEFRYKCRDRNYIYAQVDVFSSINRRKTQVNYKIIPGVLDEGRLHLGFSGECDSMRSQLDDA